MPGPINTPQTTVRPIGWDQAGQGYRAPTLYLGKDAEWELRAHDAEALAAILAGTAATALHTEGVDVVLAAGVLTAVTPWIDTEYYSEIMVHLENRGAAPVTYNEARWSERAAGTWPFRVGLVAAPAAGEGVTLTLPATAAAAWASPGTKARFGQIQSISAVGTTVRCWTILRRGGASGGS